MIKWACQIVIGLLCFAISAALLWVIPPLLLPPGFEFGSMSSGGIVAAGVAYIVTPGIYRKLAGLRKRQP